MNRAIFKAYYESDQNIGKIPVLLELAQTVGLEPKGLKEALKSRKFESKILADEEQADQLGIDGVPLLMVTYPGEKLAEGRRASEVMAYEELKTSLNDLLKAAA